ncbi:hypothetical protein LY78DRAFT_661632 [Colletotrichum sublineola]|nr:hypothetical protein LY78DRAFT_661632 [Colletotrichum sublineola]
MNKIRSLSLGRELKKAVRTPSDSTWISHRRIGPPHEREYTKTGVRNQLPRQHTDTVLFLKR